MITNAIRLKKINLEDAYKLESFRQSYLLVPRTSNWKFKPAYNRCIVVCEFASLPC